MGCGSSVEVQPKADSDEARASKEAPPPAAQAVPESGTDAERPEAMGPEDAAAALASASVSAGAAGSRKGAARSPRAVAKRLRQHKRGGDSVNGSRSSNGSRRPSVAARRQSIIQCAFQRRPSAHDIDLPASRHAKRRRGRKQKRARGTDKNVLVVDDNKVCQRITSAGLIKSGYSVKVCSDGRTALVEAATGKYGVVLMDINLPGISGIDAARAIRSVEATESVDSADEPVPGDSSVESEEEEIDPDALASIAGHRIPRAHSFRPKATNMPLRLPVGGDGDDDTAAAAAEAIGAGESAGEPGDASDGSDIDTVAPPSLFADAVKPPTTPSAPVIIIATTASVTADDLATYDAVGMDGCIGKGSHIETAVQSVRDAIAEKPDRFVFVNSSNEVSFPAFRRARDSGSDEDEDEDGSE